MNKQRTFFAITLLGIILLTSCASPAQITSQSPSTISNEPFTGQKLNLNTVSGNELLATIPGFPNRMTREFLEYRPYLSIQQFRREIGKYVGEDQVTEYEKYVYVPISFNSSDSETLQQIPGLDASEADTIISLRPFATREDFLSKLSEYVSSNELLVAKNYIEE